MNFPVLWTHYELQESIDALAPPLREEIRRKVTWAQVVLAATTRRLISKPTRHRDITWRRTPLKGFDYYLCWVELGSRGTQHLCTGPGQREILLRVVRDHDSSTDPLDPGRREDWQQVRLRLPGLDPRFNDQRAVVPDMPYQVRPDMPYQVRLVKGYPGSGKTVALLFCAADLASHGRVLYVTYTERLADEARFFMEAYGFSDFVSVRTLADLESDLLGNSPGSGSSLSPGDAYRRFVDTYEKGYGRSDPQLHGLGPVWWEELRAHLFGLALPFSWRRGETEIEACDLLPQEAHLRACHADEPDFSKWDTLLRNLAKQAHEDRLLAEQERARQALAALASGNLPTQPNWLTKLTCLIVDEIQDLTPVQIALLAEVARFACAQPDRDSSHTFAFIAAGDESQIVQPSGFEWGITKDLLYQRLDTSPYQRLGTSPYQRLGTSLKEIELCAQRRCPRRVAQALNRTGPLYAGTQRRHQESPADPDDTADGDLLRCQVDQKTCDWIPFLQLVSDSPGRAIVDLDGMLTKQVAELAPTDKARSALYTPQDIKGLDRDTVLVWGLADALEQFNSLQASPGLPALQARHVIGSIRVALSRSTDTLIILERQGAADPDPLKLADIDGARTISWDALCLLLQESDLTIEERIDGFLDEADEALDRDDLDRAHARVTQARGLCDLVDDPQYAQRVVAIHHRIRRRRIEPILDHAKAELDRGDHGSALRRIGEAKSALEEDDEQSLKASVAALETEIRRFPTVSAMKEAEQHRAAGRIDEALASNERARKHAAKLGDKALYGQVEEQYVQIRLQQADRHLVTGETDKAEEINAECRTQAAALGNASLQCAARLQHLAIERHRIDTILHDAEDKLAQGDTAGAWLGFQNAEKRALALTEPQVVDEVRSRVKDASTRHIEALLAEAESQLAAGHVAEARQTNMRAEDALGLAEDDALVQKVSNQLRRIDRQPAVEAMRLADESLRDDDIEMALLANEEAERLSLNLDDPELKAKVSEQKARLQFAQLLIEVESRLGREPLQDVYPVYRELKLLIDRGSLTMESVPHHAPRFVRLRDTIEPQLDQLAAELWKSAVAAVKRQDWQSASSAFHAAAEIRSSQHKPESADALDCLAERYREVPPGSSAPQQLERLMGLTTRYIACLESTKTWTKKVARGFAQDWLTELLPHLPSLPELLPHWLPGAQGLADWIGQPIDVVFTDLHKFGPDAARALRQSAVDPRQLLVQAQAEGQQPPADALQLCRLLDYVEGLLPF